MPSTLIDSAIYGDLFGTAAMRAIFSDEGLVERWLAVEAALARAQARLGLIPAAAAAVITDRAVPASIDMARLKSGTELVGRAILPLVKQLAEACGEEAGAYVHWGSTTQDIMDTATVLQARDGLALVEADLKRLISILRGLAARHRDTLMAGRTNGQQALPITFGFKAAVWLAEMARHAERLRECRPRILLVQCGAAVGTLASMGEKGLELRAALAEELGLGEPTVTWQAARDNFAEVTLLLAMLAGSLGKIAGEIGNLMRTEIGEVAEPFAPGRGASSTMPHKANPRGSEFIAGIARLAKRNAVGALDALLQEHERTGGAWMPEWAALPENFILAAGALAQANHMLAGLRVDAGRMRRNLDLTGGLMLAEAVMMGLAKKLGRQHAHEIVYEACRRVAAEGVGLLEALAAMPEVGDRLSRADLERLLDPAGYAGLAGAMVDRTLAAIEG